MDYPRQFFYFLLSLTTDTSIWVTRSYISIIKPQKTVLIKYLIQGFVMDIKNPTILLPFLQNERNNISFHPHTQHRRSSHCSEERRRVVFQGCFSKSYSPSPVSGSMEYLILNTTIRNSTKQPFHHCLTQALRGVGKNPKPPNQSSNNKTHTNQKRNQKLIFFLSLGKVIMLINSVLAVVLINARISLFHSQLLSIVIRTNEAETLAIK